MHSDSSTCQQVGIQLDDDSDSEVAAPAQHVARTQVRASAVQGVLSFKDALNGIIRMVQPFYGDSSRDKQYETVMEFVEEIESAMADLLSVQDDNKRLMVVKLFLKGNASTWVNHKMYELKVNDTTGRDFSAEPLTWDNDLRRPFLYTFLGTNTPELWIAKLQMLKLGDEKTLTPIELDNQFDKIARHAFPQMQMGTSVSEMVLAPYYADIVKKEKWLYTSILRGSSAGNRPTTLKKWKQAMADAFIADAQIKAMNDRMNEASNRSRGGSYKPAGRGGKASQGGQSAPQQSVSALYDDEYERSEGEQETDTTQQSLAAGGSGRGGRGGGQRGGRGGRGRGGGGANLTPVQKQMYGRGECFVCGKTGHLQYQCPERTMDRQPQQQSNAVAGQ